MGQHSAQLAHQPSSHIALNSIPSYPLPGVVAGASLSTKYEQPQSLASWDSPSQTPFQQSSQRQSASTNPMLTGFRPMSSMIPRSPASVTATRSEIHDNTLWRGDTRNVSLESSFSTPPPHPEVSLTYSSWAPGYSAPGGTSFPYFLSAPQPSKRKRSGSPPGPTRYRSRRPPPSWLLNEQPFPNSVHGGDAVEASPYSFNPQAVPVPLSRDVHPDSVVLSLDPLPSYHVPSSISTTSSTSSNAVSRPQLGELTPGFPSHGMEGTQRGNPVSSPSSNASSQNRSSSFSGSYGLSDTGSWNTPIGWLGGPQYSMQRSTSNGNANQPHMIATSSAFPGWQNTEGKRRESSQIATAPEYTELATRTALRGHQTSSTVTPSTTSTNPTLDHERQQQPQQQQRQQGAVQLAPAGMRPKSSRHPLRVQNPDDNSDSSDEQNDGGAFFKYPRNTNGLRINVPLSPSTTGNNTLQGLVIQSPASNSPSTTPCSFSMSPASVEASPLTLPSTKVIPRHRDHLGPSTHLANSGPSSNPDIENENTSSEEEDTTALKQKLAMLGESVQIERKPATREQQARRWNFESALEDESSVGETERMGARFGPPAYSVSLRNRTSDEYSRVIESGESQRIKRPVAPMRDVFGRPVGERAGF